MTQGVQTHSVYTSIYTTLSTHLQYPYPHSVLLSYYINYTGISDPVTPPPPPPSYIDPPTESTQPPTGNRDTQREEG